MRQIFQHPYAVKLEEYAIHPAVSAMANHLAAFYFKQFKKKTSASYEQVHHYFVLSILFYPIQARCLTRVYKPFWSYPAFCSWIRKSVTPHTKQYYFKHIHIHDKYLNYSILFDVLKETNTGWLKFQIQMLQYESQRNTLAGKLCRLIIYPFLYYKFDDILNEQYAVAHTSYLRKVRRKSNQPTASSLRIGKNVWLFGDKNCGKENGWIDIRENKASALWFQFKYKKNGTGEGMDITVDPSRINYLRNEIKVVLDNNATPHFKFYLINGKMQNFGQQISGATGSGSQMFELDRWYQQKLRKTIFPALSPEYRTNLANHAVDIKQYIAGRQLVHPVNIFKKEKVEDEQVFAIFSPYR